MARAAITRHRTSPIESLEPRTLLCYSPAHFPQSTPLPAAPPVAASAKASPSAASVPAGAGLFVPAYSSRPSSTHKLYIDFDGDFTDFWGGWFIFSRKFVGTTPAYDIDGDTANFSETELTNIRLIWQKTASLFSMFDLDVTTIDPGSLDDGVAAKVVVGGNGSWYGRGGGVALRNSFWSFGENISFVWRGQENPRDVAEGVAHEAGHMFGLKHQSISAPGSVAVEYRGGYIMGAGGSDEFGAYWGTGPSSATDSFDGSLDYSGIQNDYDILDDLGVVPDDYGNSIATAFSMTPAGEGYINSGVLESTTDVDFFRVNVTLGTPLTIKALSDLPPPMGPVLNIRMDVFNSTGSLVATADNPTRDETFSLVSATDSVFYVAIRRSVTASSIFNIGSYSLQVARGIAGDDGPSTARRVFGFGTPYTPTSESDNRLLQGRSSFNDNIGGGDAYDWYATPLIGRANYRFLLSGLSADADILLVRDKDGDGDFELTGEDLIASGTNPGSLSDQINFDATFATAQRAYLVVRYNSTEGSTPYTLRVTVDRSNNQASGTPSVSSFRFTSRDYDVQQNYADFVDPSDVDAYAWSSADSFGSGIITSRSVVRIEMTEILQPATLSAGFDSNFNGILDPGEILSTVNGTPAAPPVIEAAALFDPSPSARLIILASSPSAPGTNYLLTIRLNLRPTGTVNINDLSLAENGLFTLPSRAGFEFAGSGRGGLGTGDNVALDLGFQPAGPIEIETQSPDPSSNTPLPSFVELIRDVDGDRLVDPGEVIASGLNISTVVSPGDTAGYFLRIRGDANTQQPYAFKTLVRNAFVLRTQGTSISQPLILPQGSNGFFEGYVAGLQTQSLLNRDVNFHRFTLTSARSISANVLPQNMNSGQPLQNDVNLAVVQDKNGNGLLDADEWIAGRKGNGTTSGFVSATLPPGTYFLAVMASPFERQTSPLQMDYRLNYFFDEVFDATAPTVSGTSFQFEQAAIGLQVDFSEDISQSLSIDDYIVESLTPGVPSPTPLGQAYDQQTNTLYVPLDPQTPDGNYRLKIFAGNTSDLYGNPLASDYLSNSLFILRGDANRDRRVDTLDFNRLISNFGGGEKVFSQGDFSYSGTIDSVDFGILVSQFGKTLPAPAPAAMPVASRPATGATVFGQSPVSVTDEALDSILL